MPFSLAHAYNKTYHERWLRGGNEKSSRKFWWNSDQLENCIARIPRDSLLFHFENSNSSLSSSSFVEIMFNRSKRKKRKKLISGPEEEKLLGSILLPSYRVTVCKPEDKVNRKFAFKAEHANMRTYHFAADSRESMNQWVNALTLATLLQDPSP